MKAAGVRQFGGPIETLDLPEPRALRPDEVLIEVRASGVGNWDNFARTGDWDLGVRPPMALGVEAAANAARSGASDAIRAVRDGGRLATITSDPPPAERGITVRAVLVAPDGRRLGRLVQLLAQGALTVRVGEQFPLERGAAALDQVRHGRHGTAIVLQPERAR